jgi:hypothetical protein
MFVRPSVKHRSKDRDQMQHRDPIIWYWKVAQRKRLQTNANECTRRHTSTTHEYDTHEYDTRGRHTSTTGTIQSSRTAPSRTSTGLRRPCRSSGDSRFCTRLRLRILNSISNPARRKSPSMCAPSQSPTGWVAETPCCSCSLGSREKSRDNISLVFKLSTCN